MARELHVFKCPKCGTPQRTVDPNAKVYCNVLSTCNGVLMVRQDYTARG